MGARVRAPVDKGVRFGRCSQREAKVRHRTEAETGRTEASFGHRNGGESQAQRHGGKSGIGTKPKLGTGTGASVGTGTKPKVGTGK